jgi:hypothetical protein
MLTLYVLYQRPCFMRHGDVCMKPAKTVVHTAICGRIGCSRGNFMSSSDLITALRVGRGNGSKKIGFKASLLGMAAGSALLAAGIAHAQHPVVRYSPQAQFSHLVLETSQTDINLNFEHSAKPATRSALAKSDKPTADFTGVGDIILNPTTGLPELVVSVDTPGVFVTTNVGNQVLLLTTVGDTFDDPEDSGYYYYVEAITVNGGTGLVESVSISRHLDAVLPADVPGLAATTINFSVSQSSTPDPIVPGVSTPSISGTVDGAHVRIEYGDSGDSGRDGALFVSAQNGDNGDPGPSFTEPVAAGNIATTSAYTPGVAVASVGGRGGNGGDQYLGGSGGRGGYGGAGGNVTVNTEATVHTTGDNSHGVFVQSRSGTGGNGGDGWLAGGGSGGSSVTSGTVTLNNYGDVHTEGDEAYGLYGQSVGGGAGNGGGSFSIVGFGGDSTFGSSGGSVYVNNHANILTEGVHAIGLFAQSVGGGGGSAGTSAGVVALGGSGGGGGNGGYVRARNYGTITTTNHTSHGMLVQSIGGGGGSAGTTGGVAAIGGEGGGGGTGDNVLAVNDGFIETRGNDAVGMLVQSIGGGGGEGASTGGLVAIGSDGSAGGGAGTVTVEGTGNILTGGNNSHGVVAQSIGGGGGSGGTTGGLAAVGGDGEAGGDASAVEVTMNNVTTTGEAAIGIIAQSIGGGGGNGSAAGGLVAIGGQANSGGGTGDTVVVTTTGLVQTIGDHAHGILAQSIGGGGGNGGSSGGMAAIGGSGSAGNDADTVTIHANGDIRTGGDFASAIVAQSIGGGGGNGGDAASGGLFGSVAVGGSGATGGGGFEVEVNTTGNILTTGEGSTGILIQSVGGGGGSGGSAVAASIGAFFSASVAIGGDGAAGGDGGLVTANIDGQVHTVGNGAHGLVAQSIGGGGGSGGESIAASASIGIGASASVSISIGGDGGAGGDSDTVDVTTTNSIITEGDNANGVLAQSVGGGGGNGGWSVAATVAASDGVAIGASVALGGDGSAGGFGGTVILNASGTVETFGDGSHALVAQSLGGGGGNGGFSFAGGASVAGGTSVSANLSLGGDGAAGSHGGSVTLTSSDTIITHGENSNGLLGQSIGGGGGNGGWSGTGSIGVAGGTGVTVGVSLGGDGGTGAYASDVYVESTGTITTWDHGSSGVVAQSIGGGGGNGGFSFAGSLNAAGSNAISADVALGGDGGSGSTGGTVDVLTTETVYTMGNNAAGIIAQSIGGGGGNGGWSATGTIGLAGSNSVSVGVSLGGDGGTGNNADAVVVDALGQVGTEGDSSIAVLAQSIGGGGGDGGFAFSGTIGVSGSAAVGVNVALGGSGANAGNGGSVFVTSGDIVATEGANSHGLVAQSIGGGGGNGGWSGTGTVSVALGSAGVGVGVSLGGSGGTGGNANYVDVVNDGAISTLGDSAHAILAQAIGGGGGNGGFSLSGGLTYGTNSVGANVSLGGDGGFGGNGGIADLLLFPALNGVEVDNNSALYTEGSNAFGLVAQSIGGGGGNGGWSAALSGSASSSNSLAAAVAIGGSGGTGGTGSSVYVNNSGMITTLGDGGTGLLAQSIGGGGGTGGFALSGSLSVASSNAAAISVSVGGSGGTGGAAARVDVDNTAQITTAGEGANAVMAQSIGGGGGTGGWTGSLSVGLGSTGGYSASVGVGGDGGAGGDAGTVSIDNEALIATVGNDSTGLLAQSIGGGGGTGGFSLAVAGSVGSTRAIAANVTVGGTGGTAGDADDVRITSVGQLTTIGDRSHGVFAQSIGGGGGTGGWTGNLAATFSSSSNGSVNVGLGGDGGGGGAAGNVIVDHTGRVDTQGDGSHGLFAQSVGGGGGNGGFTVSGALSAGSSARSLNVSLGGTGGTAGTAGTVTVDSAETLTTSGAGSHGILAQSIGGGGGNGGFAGSFTGQFTSSSSLSLGISLGGDGAGGGSGNTVDVESTSNIGTTGDSSHGIFAQSVGGGGGSGGSTYSASISGSRTNSLNVALGGSGGVGGIGGSVDVMSDATITTEGSASYGIFAQSIGGGGGQGGFAGALSMTGSNSNAVNLSLGGNAGNGSIGGTVTVDVHGLIQTDGEASHGVFAQSIGGGGGQGGSVGVDESNYFAFLAGSTSVSYGTNTNNVSIGIGGEGGDGSLGGDVTVTSDAQIVTLDRQSMGIYAQSIGGGGGDAGVGFATSGAAGAGRNGSYSLALGGGGGTGNDGGVVDVTNNGAIFTMGGASDGIFAQSVGGGGGRGGDAGGLASSYATSDTQRDTQVSVSIGGGGGAGGDGRLVTVTNNGQIYTQGEMSNGIFAQSVGGGGGVGGLVSESGGLVSDVVGAIDRGDATEASISIGGAGGAAGDGGEVVVNNTGAVFVAGLYGGYGVAGQSVGGGGGLGGSGLAGSLSIGGAGGAAGDGGDVTITNSGSIVTQGSLGYGIFAQSVGGGGGVGGATNHDGGSGDRDALQHVLAAAQNTLDFFALIESFEEPAFSLNIGGRGGAAGDGGDVTVVNTGSIITSGDGAHGIMAQSVGGGGGIGGGGHVQAVGDITISGLGGTAGDGGDVHVTHTGNITTSGYGAYGIFAQSVGGGGGVAGDTSFGFGDFTIPLSINPFSGGDGDGGDVTVISTGDIMVRGTGGMGIFAQSVGGGGGMFGITDGSLGSLGSLLGVGTAGSVSVTHTGNVIAPDLNAIAAIAQSDSADGNDNLLLTFFDHIRGGSLFGMGVLFDGGATNTLNTAGTVSAVSGLAISGTTGDETVYNTGTVIGNVDLGSGDNAFDNQIGSVFVAFDTIDLRDAATPQVSRDKNEGPDVQPARPTDEAGGATLNDAAASSKAPGADVSEVYDPAASEAALDTVMTDLGLPAVSDVMPVFEEKGGDLSVIADAGTVGPDFVPAPIAVATFRNAGDFQMGLSASRVPIDLLNGDVFGNLDANGDPLFNLYYGARVINTVALDGHYEQTADGHLAFDVAFGPYASDLVNVTGMATVDGTGDAILTWLENRDPVTLFATVGGGVDNGLIIADTIAVDFSIEADAMGIHLNLDTDFGIDSLNRNGRALGDHMDSAVDVGGSAGIGRLLALIGNLQDADIDVYHALFRELNPEPHLAAVHGQLSTANSFSEDLFSCGSPISSHEEECAWSRLEMSTRDRASSFEAFRVESASTSFSGGFEQQIGNDWSVVGAINYEHIDQMDVDENRSRTTGQGFSAGVGVEKNNANNHYYGASLSAGWSWLETERTMTIFERGTGISSPETGYFRASTHVGNSWRHGQAFASPEIRLDLTNLIHTGLVEEGLEGNGVEVLEHDQFLIAVNPEVTMGYVFNETDTSALVTSITMGMRISSQDRLELPVRFIGANPDATPAEIGSVLDQVVYQLGADIQITGDDNLGLHFSYDGEFGDDTEFHRAGFDLRLRF